MLRVQVPQIRGRAEPSRSQLWSQVAPTREVLKRLMVEMDAGGLSQRDIDYSVEKARGPLVLSKSTVSELTDRVTQEDAACRPRELSGDEVASLVRDAVYAPRRRWGSKTGGRCVWGRSAAMGGRCS